MKNTRKLQIKKVIYNKAIKSYIQDNYDTGVHFGSMDDNLKEILKNLSLENIMDSSLKLPFIDVNKLYSVNGNNNEFANFDIFENFTCTFVAKENVNSKEFMKGIKKLETSFLSTYNEKVGKEHIELEDKNRIAIKKRETREILFFVIIALIALVAIYLFSK